MLSLLIHEHRRSFQLFRFLICVSNVLYFSVYKCFTSFIIFIDRYFILLHAIIDGIVFLSSFWIVCLFAANVS